MGVGREENQRAKENTVCPSQAHASMYVGAAPSPLPLPLTHFALSPVRNLLIASGAFVSLWAAAEMGLPEDNPYRR
jgi:hypothetical protein